MERNQPPVGTAPGFPVRARTFSPTLKRGLVLSLILHAMLVGLMRNSRLARPVSPQPAERNVSIALVVEEDTPTLVATEPIPTPPLPAEPAQPAVATAAPTPAVAAAAQVIHDPPTQHEISFAVMTEPPPSQVEADTPVPHESAGTTRPTTNPPPLVATAPAVGARAALSLSPGPSTTLAQPLYRVNPEPPYPAAARRRRQQGVVILKVHVTAEGRAARLHVAHSSGFKALDDAALAAVKSWEFEPARIGTAVVNSDIEVPVRFQLIP